jgi:subtilisin family serine protease
MQTYRAQGQASAPNDPLFPLQPAAREWRLADLRELATGRNVRVAVIDSMVDAGHPDLAGQVWLARNFAPERPSAPETHGTGVAGIIAAVADNHLGIAGVAPGVRLMALRACWQEPQATSCNTLSLAEALHFAIDHDAQVINMSLAGPPDPLLGRLLDVAVGRGIVLVGAADPNLPHGGFPASHAGVIAVSDDATAAHTLGAVLAPGRDVPTTEPGGRWYLVNGSSYAAAHVSGLYALMRERRPKTHAAPILTAARGGGVDACASVMGSVRPCLQCACAQPTQAAAWTSATARP